MIEGPSDEVNPITAELENCVADLLNNKSFKEIQVDPKFHKHIIGKAGANGKWMKNMENELLIYV